MGCGLAAVPVPGVQLQARMPQLVPVSPLHCEHTSSPIELWVREGRCGEGRCGDGVGWQDQAPVQPPCSCTSHPSEQVSRSADGPGGVQTCPAPSEPMCRCHAAPNTHHTRLQLVAAAARGSQAGTVNPGQLQGWGWAPVPGAAPARHVLSPAVVSPPLAMGAGSGG